MIETTEDPRLILDSASPEAEDKAVVAVTKRARTLFSAVFNGPARSKSETFAGSTAERGLSAQIPPEEIERLANNIVEPPLGARSFEELARLLLQSTDFSVVVNQLANDVVGVGYQIVGRKADEEPDAAEVDEALVLLENASSQVTLSDILLCAWTDYESIGNAWVEVIRIDNNPLAPPSGFAHAPGVTMRINRNLKGYVQLSLDESKATYFRQLFSDPKDPTSLYPKGHALEGQVMNEMIFLRDYNAASPWYGVPRVVPAINAIKGSIASAERNIAFFQNRAMPEWAVIVSGDTDDIAEEDLKKFRTEVEEYFRNCIKGQNYQTLYTETPKGITIEFQKISIEVDDADHRMYRLDNRDEVLRAYQMMPNRVGIIETGNIGAGTGQSQIEIYNSSVIKPRRARAERVFNQILMLPKPKGLGLKTVRFRFNPIDTIDESREVSIAAQLGNLGWMTINEGRAYVTKFLDVKLEQIPEEWADLPLAILLAILSGGAAAEVGLPSSEQADGGMIPGVSAVGVGLPMTRERLVESIRGALTGPVSGDQRAAIDRAYRRAAARGAPTRFVHGTPSD